MHKNATYAKIGVRDIEFVSFNSGGDGEHSDIVFVGISNHLVTERRFYETVPLDRAL